MHWIISFILVNVRIHDGRGFDFIYSEFMIYTAMVSDIDSNSRELIGFEGKSNPMKT